MRKPLPVNPALGFDWNGFKDKLGHVVLGTISADQGLVSKVKELGRGHSYNPRCWVAQVGGPQHMRGQRHSYITLTPNILSVFRNAQSKLGEL